MSRELLASQKNHSGIVLDPRTKLAVLTTIAVFILGGSYEGVISITSSCWRRSPCASALGRKMERRCPLSPDFWGKPRLELFGLSYLTGVANFIAVAIVGLFLRFTPGIVMGYFVVTTTTVSEFVAAMERLHLPQQITIPMSVMVPLFPDGGGRMERHWGRHADARRPLWRWKGRLYSGIPHGSHDDLLRQDWRRVECGGTDPRPGRTGQADQHL